MSFNDSTPTHCVKKSQPSPEIRLEVFKKHWMHMTKVMEKETVTYDDAEPVVYYMEQMTTLMSEEQLDDDSNESGPVIVLFCLREQLFGRVYDWSQRRCSGEILEKMKRHQLAMMSLIVECGQPNIVTSEQVLDPLMRLLREYSLRASRQLELALVRLVHLVSVRAANETTAGEGRLQAVLLRERLPLLHPLVPFLHREGRLGRGAREAVLLQLATTQGRPLLDEGLAEEAAVAVALQSDFCPVLATGLSALYSALPRRLPPFCCSVLLGQLGPPLFARHPELAHFLEYLGFCCAVNKVTHPLVKEAVLHYIYNGFLLPVLGASLNQNSLEEVTTATMYLELCLRTIDEPGVLKAFLCFTVAEAHDGNRILDSLINRLNSNTGLGVATLSLLCTVVSFNCEDIMFELIFRHLIPQQKSSLVCDFKETRRELADASKRFLELRLDGSGNGSGGEILDPNYLRAARRGIEECSQACETAWHFQYGNQGPNPSAEELQRAMVNQQHYRDGGQNTIPFHGFLDHYSQLLEMRDSCRRNSSMVAALTGGRPGHHAALLSQGDSDDEANCSLYSVPLSSPALSQRSTADTITSMRFEPDSQLDRCLQRLRYPSQDDLREHRQHYTISCNMMLTAVTTTPTTPLDGDDSRSCSTPDTVHGNNCVAAEDSDDYEREPHQQHRHWAGFDRVVELDPTTSTATDTSSCSSPPPVLSEQLVEHISRLRQEDHDSSNSEARTQEGLLGLLDSVQSPKRPLELSLEAVMEHCAASAAPAVAAEQPHRPTSPASVLSLHSTITMDDDSIIPRRPPPIAAATTQNVAPRSPPCIGNFISTILERLESMVTNPFQINLQLSGLLCQLLSFPHPLLRDFLLLPDSSPTSSKTLFRVLDAVRAKLQDAKLRLNIAKCDNSYFELMYREARNKMERRCRLLASAESLEQSEDALSACSTIARLGQLQWTELVDGTVNSGGGSTTQKRHFNLLQFLKLSGSGGGDNGSQKSNGGSSDSQMSWFGGGRVSRSQREELDRTRQLNIAFAAVIFDDICLEIAAYAKEHSVHMSPACVRYLVSVQTT